MNRFVEWWKTDKRYILLLKTVLMALLPVVCCLITCVSQGKSIGDLYLPMSEWNDELFYFKQVEGIVNYGYPQGYFGFNESHALKLSFAAWSPALVFPWIIWGLIFGWNLMSPIICNIVLLTLSMILFVVLVRPTWKQLGILTLLFCLYTPFVRYMLSGMPEIICFSMLIIFYSLAINYTEREKNYKLVILFVMAGVLTLMRPYMLLFLLLPAFFWIRKKRWWGALGSALVFGVVLGCYGLIKHYLGAEYFAPLFFTDWVTTFFEKGFFSGVYYFFAKIYWMGCDFLEHVKSAFHTGLASGAFFAGYLATMAVLLWQSLSDYRSYRKKKKSGEANLPKQFFPQLHLAVCFVGMLFALLLMYKLTEGSKHLLTFMAVGVFMVSLMKTTFYKKAVFLGITFVYFYSYLAVNHPYDYQVPFAEEVRQEQIADATEVLAKEMKLSETDVPNYDNDVIWTLYDNVPDESGTPVQISMKWQLLYAIPEGFGISCCEGEYVRENLNTLQSRYLATIVDGEVDALCRENGYRELYRDHEVVFYMR